MGTCENIICILVDSAADSKLKRLKEGEIFGVEKPGGEARIYVGQTSNEDEYDKFFGFDKSETVRFEVTRADLLDYLLKAKDEFIHPKNSYRLDISQFYNTLLSQTLELDDNFTIEFKKNADKRYYLSPVVKGGNPYSKYVRSLCLPLLTHYNLIKAVDSDDVRYYFKLIYSDCNSYENKSNLPQLPESQKANIQHYLRAMRTKPFLLLAGISGTGKSRIVKQMAFDSCPNLPELRKDATSPGNYCLVEVKPNWHDSSELIGYASQIGRPHYEVTPFVRFLAKATLYEEQRVPFFVCLDEMNLAPVEQYFAEFLSVLESRKVVNGRITSEALIPADVFANARYERQLKEDLFGLEVKKISEEEGHSVFEGELADDELAVYNRFKEFGLRIPSNLIVIGTVNMDETTHQFSRKVIDRAMTIEMNLPEGEPFLDFFNNARDLEYAEAPLSADLFLPSIVKAADAVEVLAADNADKTDWLKKEVSTILTNLNAALEDTPFKIAYRVQNELVLYFYELWKEDREARWRGILNTSVDQILMMKVLPRIEGDEDLLEKPLASLANFCAPYPKATVKVAEMQSRLDRAHFTSYWP
jgi:hypothetical protein